jgi:hypothetical protein
MRAVKAKHSSTRKKVVIRKLDKELVKGYADSDAFLTTGNVEVLDLEGRLLKLPLDHIKGIYFVRDFDGQPDRPERKVFLSRPRLTGLWVRMTFKDAEVLDGLISENLLSLEPHGFLVTPPDVYSNNLKIYIPRSALAALEVLDVISNGARRPYRQVRRARVAPADASTQIGLFPPAGRPETP